MPRFANISHMSFSVRDADKTARWWEEVFGLDRVSTIEEEGWRSVLLSLTDTIAIEFQQHDANRGETFDPTRTGFDHMGLKVDSREQLDEWQAHFERLGVEHTPVVEKDYGSGPMSGSRSRTPTGSSSRCSTGPTTRSTPRRPDPRGRNSIRAR